MAQSFIAMKQDTDEIKTLIGQIGQPRLQTKTVTPTLSQQIIAPDSGYDALSSAVVNPVTSAIDSNIRPENIANNVTILGVTGTNAVDLEKFIMRDANREHFTLALNGDIPSYACYNQIKLTGVIDQTATSIGVSAFSGCSSLQEIDLRNATSIGTSAFSGCSSLQEIDLRNITSIGGSAFQSCSSLQEIDLRNATSIGVNAFSGCSSLQEIDLRNATSIGTSAFQSCSSLQEIDLRNATSIGTSAFSGCSSLQEIDLRTITSIGGSAFSGCSQLKLIDLTSRTTPTTLTNSAAFSSTNSTWIAVVADDTIKAAFQSATNWSTFASHFRTIAEVEAEVGMTYDEYYLQIFGHARNEVSA